MDHQPFAASHEGDPETPRPRFVVDRSEDPGCGIEQGNAPGPDVSLGGETAPDPILASDPPAALNTAVDGQPTLLVEPPNPSWREEVSERLHRYRARRRPRAPRYPSLRLKFETPEAGRTSYAGAEATLSPTMSNQVMASRQSVARDCAEIPAEPEIAIPPTEVKQSGASEQPARLRNETIAKILEFPRWAYTPAVRLNELAEPVLDRPRILEAPEVALPPPAMGGITIEEAPKPEPERRPGIDMPLQPAPLGQVALAATIDGVVVLMAGVIFSAIFYQWTHSQPDLRTLIILGFGLLSVLWAAYQYLLIVYSGTTPGLRAMGLQLQRFDGTLPNRRLRRWRVLGSLLSGISLGMGYAWQFLDEDALCWHERVTKTYLAPQRRTEIY